MAFANSVITDLVAETIKNRSEELFDSATNNNAITWKLKQKGNVRLINGGTEVVERLLFQQNNNAAWYSGYDQLPVAAQDVISGAEFLFKQLACAITFSGLEILENSGEYKIKDLVKDRVKGAEAAMANLLAAGTYSDGTGFGGKQLVGLGAAVVANPTSGVYGNIDRSLWPFWRNQFTGSLGAQTTSNIQPNMNKLWTACVRGKNRPDLILADNNLYSIYEGSLQQIQRFTEPREGQLGFLFDSLKYKNADVVLDGGIGGNCPTNVMYFLNTDYIFLRPHADRNMVELDPERRVSINQDAYVNILAWCGAFTSGGPQFCGYFQGS